MLWFKIGFWLDHFQATVIFISFSLVYMNMHYHNQKIKEKIKSWLHVSFTKFQTKANINHNIAYTQLQIL